MPRQLKLTLVAADYVRIAGAADLQSALMEMLRAYFQQIVCEEKNADDRKDRREP